MYLYDISSERLPVLLQSKEHQTEWANQISDLNRHTSTHNLYLNDLLKLVDQCIDRCTTSEWKRMEKDGKGWKRMEKDGKGWKRMEKDGKGTSVATKNLKFWKHNGSHRLKIHFSEQSRSPQSSRLTICHPLGVMTVTVTFSPLFCTVLWSSHWGDQHAQHWLLLRILSFKHPFWEWSNFDLSHVERVVHICSWRNLAETSQLSLYCSFLLLTSSLPSWQNWQMGNTSHTVHSFCSLGFAQRGQPRPLVTRTPQTSTSHHKDRYIVTIGKPNTIAIPSFQYLDVFCYDGTMVWCTILYSVDCFLTLRESAGIVSRPSLVNGGHKASSVFWKTFLRHSDSGSSLQCNKMIQRLVVALMW